MSWELSYQRFVWHTVLAVRLNRNPQFFGGIQMPACPSVRLSHTSCGRYLFFYAVVCVQMYYGGSEEDLSAVTDTMRYTGAAVPPRLSSRPAQAATDCHPSYAGTLTHPPADPTSFCEVRGHVST